MHKPSLMPFTDDEFKEWHQYIYQERNRYKRFVEAIVNGVPTIAGMASDYRQLDLKEIKQRARALLDL